MSETITTSFADMPTSIRSYVIKGLDDYCIVINSKLSYEMRLKAYQHELDHIYNGDFERKTDIDLIEIRAHKDD